MSEYSELNCPGCGEAMSVHNRMPEWFEQLCPFCVRKFTVERWRVAAKRIAKQAAEAKKAAVGVARKAEVEALARQRSGAEKKEGERKPETGTDLAGGQGG